MSISNLGWESGTGFTPIINPPEAAILSVSRMSVGPVVPLDLTYDHRIINGVETARFLSGVVQILEEPKTIALLIFLARGAAFNLLGTRIYRRTSASEHSRTRTKMILFADPERKVAREATSSLS